MVQTFRLRSVASVALFAVCAPFLAGCGGGGNRASDNYTPAQTNQRPGLSTKQKVMVLAGAAALYYVFKKKNESSVKQQAGLPANAQLYRSESTGGIYYRDAQHRPHWVVVPKEGIQVPADDYNRVQAQRNQWQNIPVHQPSDPFS